MSWCVFMVGVTSALAEEGEIPITTKNTEALALFKQGRDLYEQSRGAEALTFFEKAITADPTFAMAYLHLANAQTSPKGFFENLRKAMALAGKVSEGERLLILATQAAADNTPVRQKGYLDKLVRGYPKDKRAYLALGSFYFGEQEYALAINELKKATDLSPVYSPPYNLLGYAYSRSGNYTEAEKAFRKYTELIPDEPNPHDSYAELLMKEGKFEESIQEYQKALSINPKFYNSYLGLGMDYVLEGKHYDAIKTFRTLHDIAPDDGIRQQALFASVICYVDQRQFARAVAEEQRNYEISKKNDDAGAMIADLGTLGDLLIEVGPIDQARARYEKAKEIADSTDVPAGVKEFAHQVWLSGLVRVTLHNQDFQAAHAAAAEFKKEADKSHDPAFKQAYQQLAGMIALNEKKYDNALAELRKADQRSPRTLLLMGQAYAAKGDNAKAKEFLTKAANFNEVNIEFAFVHAEAKQLLAGR